MRCTAPLKTPRAELSSGVWIDARRAVYLENLGTLVLADLHWGYAVSHRAAGNLLPVWGDDEIARRLLGLLADYEPREMVWLGDSLHTLAGQEAAESFLRTKTLGIAVTIVSGNHDKRWLATSQADGTRHEIKQNAVRGNFFFHHGDCTLPVPAGSIEVIGHHHPALSWSDGAGTRVKIPALISSPRRIILPAFSPWAAGTPWNDRLEAQETLWAVAPSRIFAVKW
jgi:metallophosphoesterase superfamily enzyme